MIGIKTFNDLDPEIGILFDLFFNNAQQKRTLQIIYVQLYLLYHYLSCTQHNYGISSSILD